MSAFTDPNELPRFAELDAEYEILRELGRGGTAVVYLARERELGREVTIKVIRAQYVEDREAAARLVREARTIAGLQHPNIVVLYGTRRLGDGSLALFMQYVPGRTLKAEIAAAGPMPFPRVRQILADIGRALAYAHRQRIVHRDLKPENVYIDEDVGVARLSDFGIARPWDAESGLTLPGTAIGTPAYMSPEQIDGTALDGRSDLYSLGMIGYEMLTGTRPWAGESLFNIIYRQKHEDLPSLETVRPDIPAPLLLAVEGALAKDREQRWADASEFLEVLAGDEVAAPTDTGTTAVTAAPADASRVAAPTAGANAVPGNGSPTKAEPDADVEPGPDSVTVQYRRPLADEAEPAGPDLPRRSTRRLVVAAVMAIVLVASAVSAATFPWVRRGDTADVLSEGAGATAPQAAGQDPAPNSTATAALAYAALGATQTGIAGDTLAEPLMLRLEDATGAAVAGVGVRFMVVAGAGELIPAEGVTDESGIVAVRYVPGVVGHHRIDALAEGVRSVSFTAAARPTGPVRLTAQSPSVVTDSGRTVLSVRAEDARGHAVVNAPVEFAVVSGDGAVDSTTMPTDSAGVAQVTWTLAPTGVQEVSARIRNEPGTTVLFRGGHAAPEEPADLPVRGGMAAGGTHTCLLTGAGALTCWGGNDRGQLGDGTTTRRQGPISVAAGEQLSMVATGVSHSCAIGRGGAAWCWGSNDSGQLGDGTTTSRTSPVRVAAGERFTAIATGTAHTCALTADRALYCWGQNTHGQVGDGSRTSRLQPVRVAGNRQFRSVVTGWSHTCALDSAGATFCWGRNDNGQLGDGSTADRAAPVPVAGGHAFASLAAGSGHSCGVRTDGALLCWGRNDQGQLGTGTVTSSATPVTVRSDVPFSAVAAGAVHTCGLTRDGTAFCWGRNSYGQLGDGTTDARSVPTAVAGGLRFAALTTSGAHSCGRATGGDWFCWGYNLDGQLGDGSATNRLRPTAAGRR